MRSKIHESETRYGWSCWYIDWKIAWNGGLFTAGMKAITAPNTRAFVWGQLNWDVHYMLWKIAADCVTSAEMIKKNAIARPWISIHYFLFRHLFSFFFLPPSKCLCCKLQVGYQLVLVLIEYLACTLVWCRVFDFGVLCFVWFYI